MVRWVRRGHAPNCSATGIVVGTALLTVVSAAVVVNVWADRFARWRDRLVSTPPPTAKALANPVAKLRRESFGGLLALPGAAALLALDGPATASALQAGAQPWGQTTSELEGVFSGPIEAHVAPKGRCALPCKTCYLGDTGEPPSASDDDLHQDLDALAAAGVFEVAVGGAEVTDPNVLLSLGRAIRQRSMVANLTTSGFWVTPALAEAVRDVFTQVNVSLDGLDDTYALVRGFRGGDRALHAIEVLVAAGVRVGVNTVVARANVAQLEVLGRALAERGVAEWQWLRLKPVGRAVTDYDAQRLTTAEAVGLWSRTCAIEADTGLVMRWDCAMVPFLAVHGLPPGALTALGVMGCPGGTSLVARRPEGTWSPCSFADAETASASLQTAWSDAGSWLDFRQTPAAPCNACPYVAACRGGCRVVAGFRGDPGGPDPECPQVMAFRG